MKMTDNAQAAKGRGLTNVTLRHVGMYVTDIDAILNFYTGVLGFTVSDRGPFRDEEIAFLTRDPEEHHEIVVMSGRPAGSFGTINQISFRADAFADLRATHDLLTGAGIEKIDPVDHGNALSVYFWDPEENRIEIYIPTPWYVAQPNRTVLDFSLSDEEILVANEAKCRADPSFRLASDWKASFREA
jgi:catechol 2,3-dioxygenase-like lactoylglutathione lyase family enzyme